MKLRNYLGLSIRIYFGLVRYSIFFDVLLLIILSNLGFPDKVCVIVFFVFILGWIAWIYSIKCPKCNTVFQISESDYESILKQVKDEYLEKELKEKDKK